MALRDRMRIFHDPRCVNYGQPGHPERPERILGTVRFLKQRHPAWTWEEPTPASREDLLRVHSSDYLKQVANPLAVFDADCPTYPQIDEHAARSAGAAIAAARAAMKGERAFTLMRPPGHHALRDRAMGFCYFANISLATLDAITHGCDRVAIWDFDAHHGNGTEAIVKGNEKVLFASIHQNPGWPGTGTKSFANILNYPIAPYSPRAIHVRAVEEALEKLIAFKPELLLVSAGFDAYANDPITQMTLAREDFATFGRWLSQTTVPTAAILEGGYSDELPELIDAFLTEWNSAAS